MKLTKEMGLRKTWKRLAHTIAQVQPLSEKVIKPSSPTPSIHGLHKLSLLEQAQTHTYAPAGLFYSKEQLGEFSNHHARLSNILVNSLSKNLELYYPYAGCVKDSRTITCNDVGAKFIEVKINSPMSHVANHPNSDIKDLIFPQGLPWANDSPHGLAVFQLSYFDCGGIAISTCASHKIGDAYSVYHFLSDWAALARSPDAKLSSPYFVQDSLYPSLPNEMDPPEFGSVMDGCIQKRYTFSTSQLRALKAYVAEDSSGVQNPTRTEVISALIFKCFATLGKANNSGSFRKSTLIHFANERGFYPQLPSKSIGNVITYFPTTIDQEGDMNVPNIVSSIRREKQVVLYNNKDNNVVKKNRWASDIFELAKNGGEPSYSLDDGNEYVCSSLLQIPFHELDFGWGKPVRMTIGNGPKTNAFGIVEQGNEVEVHVMLNQQDVPVFESDAQLFKFASLTPSNL